MKITINQTELIEAVKLYVKTKGMNFEGSKISFTSTRGGAGIITNIEFKEKEVDTDEIKVDDITV